MRHVRPVAVADEVLCVPDFGVQVEGLFDILWFAADCGGAVDEAGCAAVVFDFEQDRWDVV